MDYHGINMQGPFVMETGAIPVFNASDERRIKYDPSTEKMYFGSSTEWVELTSLYSEIPQNTIMLFLSDIALNGFTLLTDNGSEDKVVYITKGSAAGGDAGGTDKGTWTQPVHEHLLTPHFHPFGSHQHTFDIGTQLATSTGQLHGGSSDVQWTDHGHDFLGTVGYSAGSNTASSISVPTGSSFTPISWRPKGRNFTRQQRT